MSVLYIVLPLALLLAVVAVAAFIWAVKTGQLDDLRTPALRVLHDDLPPQLDPAYDPKHRQLLASTHAETPRARSRASLIDGDPPPSGG